MDASDGAGASWPTLDEQITVLELRSAHRVEPTLKEAEELLATVPEVTEADRARLRLVAAVAHTRLGQIREGLNEVQDVREWAIQADEPLVQARAERDLAMLMRRAGVVHTGLEHAIASVTLLGPGTTDAIRADHLLGLADSLALVGSDEESLERYHEALSVAERVNYPELTVRVVNNLAYTYFELGRLDEALPLCDRLARMGAEGDPLSSWALGTLAEVYLASGHVDRAAEALESVDMARLDATEDYVDVLMCRARIRRASGDLAGALALLDESAAAVEGQGLPGVEIRLLRDRSEIFAEQGEWEAAYHLAIEMFDRSEAQAKEAAEARVRMAQAVVEVTEARRESATYKELSYRDALTGLYNRRYVDQHLDELLAGARQAGEPVSVAFVDLDHFKQVNDRFSHEIGDRVLQVTARLLLGAVAGVSDAVVARMGGEEMLVVMPGVGPGVGLTLADRACAMVREHDWASMTPGLAVTTSVGLATSTVDGSGRFELLRAADERLYRAKDAGRDRVVGLGL